MISCWVVLLLSDKQDIINEVQGKEKYFRLSEEILRPDTAYIVDVRAKHCPDYYLQGPWSEWSSGIHWITAKASLEEEGGECYTYSFQTMHLRSKLKFFLHVKHSNQMYLSFAALPGINFYWLYISTPIILFLALLLLGYLQKPWVPSNTAAVCVFNGNPPLTWLILVFLPRRMFSGLKKFIETSLLTLYSIASWLNKNELVKWREGLKVTIILPSSKWLAKSLTALVDSWHHLPHM